MIDLKECKTKDKVIKDFFIWLFDKKDIDLHSEIDLSLATDYYDSNIYYPDEFNQFFQTEAMQRLGKISQLGSSISKNPNSYHNRLEHSKGTYNRKLEELIVQLQDEDYKKYIEDNNLKIYLIAELIKAAGHDIGHLPLSHIIETKVIGKREFHEDIGKRILLENPEIQKVLKDINPDLPLALQEVLENDILNFQAHDESNYDVDRFDYLIRDALYLGKHLSFDYQHYKILYAKTDSQGNILKNSNGSIILTDDSDESKKMIDVYENQSLKSIEAFLEERVQAYKNIYWAEETQTRDSAISLFLNQLLESNYQEAMDLQLFIQDIKSHSVKDINLDEYLKWNDLEFYKSCMEVAQNSRDENLKHLASLIIPPLDGLMNFTFSSLDLKNKPNKNYSQNEIEFLKTIKRLIMNNDTLSKNLKNKDFFSANSIYTNDSNTIDYLRNKWGNLINYSSSTVYGYKTTEPIYLYDSQGNVFTLHEHPEKSCDWQERQENMQVAFVLFPELKLKGIDEETLQSILYDFQTTSQNPAINSLNYNQVNMSLTKTENSIEDYFNMLEL